MRLLRDDAVLRREDLRVREVERGEIARGLRRRDLGVRRARARAGLRDERVDVARLLARAPTPRRRGSAACVDAAPERGQARARRVERSRARPSSVVSRLIELRSARSRPLEELLRRDRGRSWACAASPPRSRASRRPRRSAASRPVACAAAPGASPSRPPTCCPARWSRRRARRRRPPSPLPPRPRATPRPGRAWPWPGRRRSRRARRPP